MRSHHLIVWPLLFLAVAVLGHSSDSAAVTEQASRLWRLAVQEQGLLDQRGVILKDATLFRYLQDVAERLWAQVPSQLNVPTVKIIADTRIDAHTYPNGVCFLSTGMLDVLENESQLAMIIAHEMVHYAHQHTAAFYNHLQLSGLQNDSREGDGRGSAGGLDMWHIIDAAERQADSEGLAILQAAGYRDKEVLLLMANLVNCMSELGHPQRVSQLNERAERFKALINRVVERQTASAPADTDANAYRDHVAPALIANAQHALRSGEWDQAERSISRFLCSDPLNARAYYLKGEILRRQNRSGIGPDTTCIDAYEKALEIDPTFPLTHRALGELHYKAGRYQMAKPYFKAFLNLAPEDAASAFIKGYLKQCQDY